MSTGRAYFIKSLQEEIDALKLLLADTNLPEKTKMHVHGLIAQNLQSFSALYRQPRIFRRRE